MVVLERCEKRVFTAAKDVSEPATKSPVHPLTHGSVSTLGCLAPAKIRRRLVTELMHKAILPTPRHNIRSVFPCRHPQPCVPLLLHPKAFPDKAQSHTRTPTHQSARRSPSPRYRANPPLFSPSRIRRRKHRRTRSDAQSPASPSHTKPQNPAY